MASRTRHKSLFGEINKTSTEGDQSIFARLEQLNEDEIDAFGFGPTEKADLRPNALADNATTAEKWSELAFPAVHPALFAQLRQFLFFTARFAKPHTKSEVRISYRGLTVYRAALIFWANLRHGMRNLPPIPKTAFFGHLTEAIKLAAKEYELRGLRNPAHVGLAEIRQLIDHDMISTVNVEVAENHHLGWCIGKSGPQHGATSRAISLFCHVLPPQLTDNLIFSIPHRLLVIALRRKLLVGIETLDQLFEGDQCDIMIKPDSLDQPILLAAGPGRLKVTSNPLSEDRMTDYLQLRGRRLGYVKDITFNSIRRRSRKDLGRLMGPDLARKIMECDAEYRPLRHDMDRTPFTNLSAITLGESSGQAHAMIEENAQLAVNPLSADTVHRIHGAALNAMVREMVATDPDYPIDGSDYEQMKYRRRASKAAFGILFSTAVQQHEQALPNTEIEERVRNLKRSNFMEGVIELAKKLPPRGDEAQTVPGLTAQLTAEDVPTLREDGTFEEAPIEELPEEDLDMIVNEGENGVTRETDERGDEIDDVEADDIPYDVAARTFMNVLLTHTSNDYIDFKNNPPYCNLCQEDDTVEQQDKDKRYKNREKLSVHMEGHFHSARAQFGRRAKIKHSRDGYADNVWKCPYCEVVKEGVETHSYPSLNRMMRHITESSEKTGIEHDRLKTNDGWYDEDWVGVMTEGKKHRAEVARGRQFRKVRKTNNLQYTNDVELPESIPHPTLPGVLVGGPSPSDTSLPAHLSGFVEEVRPDMVGTGLETSMDLDQAIEEGHADWATMDCHEEFVDSVDFDEL